MRLQGKKAVVTAAGSGMGRAACVLFAREGAAIAAVDINAAAAQATAEAIHSSGGRAFAISADLADVDGCRHAVHDAADKLGGIDIFWNHAGEPGPAGIEQLDMVAYEHAMALNLRSGVVTVSEVVPYMRRQGGGSVLFTASTSGLVGSAFSPIYSAAKAGLVGLTRSLALQLARDRIRVNVLCPGPTETPMLRGFTARDGAEATHQSNLQAALASIPLGRLCQPLEVAYAALWLASDESSYITGVALPIDGGRHIR